MHAGKKFTKTQICVLMYLASHIWTNVNNKTKKHRSLLAFGEVRNDICWILQGKMAEAIGVHRETVCRAIGELVKMGALETRHFPNHASVYAVYWDKIDSLLDSRTSYFSSETMKMGWVDKFEEDNKKLIGYLNREYLNNGGAIVYGEAENKSLPPLLDNMASGQQTNPENAIEKADEDSDRELPF